MRRVTHPRAKNVVLSPSVGFVRLHNLDEDRHGLTSALQTETLASLLGLNVLPDVRSVCGHELGRVVIC